MKKTIGIIGGGQLGRMLIQSGMDYPVKFRVYTNSNDFASKNFCFGYTVGDLNNYDKIINFGKKCDIITIEIENVNIDALQFLEDSGKTVYPPSRILKIIRDRSLQKKFLKNNNIPTLNYYEDPIKLPNNVKKIVNKACIGGYDGYGTKIIDTTQSSWHSQLYDVPSIIEEYCEFDRELAIIVARNNIGQTCFYYPAEMKFNDQNMLDYLICPANLTQELEDQIYQISKELATSLNLVGIMAIELFQKEDEIYVNELAPRPHNSGHHTQNMYNVSQFEMLMRCLLDLSLPIPSPISSSICGATLNLLGNDNGETMYFLKEISSLENCYLHLYDKIEMKPYRKMGHLNILAHNRDELLKQIIVAKNISKKCMISSPSPPSYIPQVGIIMGSISDLPIMEDAIKIMKQFNIPYETEIVSAHRTPELMLEYGRNAHHRNLKVIIAAAGGAAHLPGMIASTTPLPVIGVPIKSGNSLDGWDSILSIIQMPGGVPTATVGLNNAQNAGLLAARILGYTDATIEHMESLKNKVSKMNDDLKKSEGIFS